jgi:hypothetical protein
MGGFEPGSPTIGISPIDTDPLSVGTALRSRLVLTHGVHKGAPWKPNQKRSA